MPGGARSSLQSLISEGVDAVSYGSESALSGKWIQAGASAQAVMRSFPQAAPCTGNPRNAQIGWLRQIRYRRKEQQVHAKDKIAACVHVYYPEIWPDLAARLAHLPAGSAIFVTCRAELHAALSAAVAADFPNAETLVMPDQGMDVLPFLRLCAMRELDRYTAVLKLHSKNRISEMRAAQGRIMMDGLCGSPDLVAQIIARFADKTAAAGMIGTAFQWRSADALAYGNRAQIRALCDRLAIPAQDWGFFTGTMFWIAGDLLRPLRDALPWFEAHMAPEGQTGGDGSPVHAMERVFGVLPQAAQRAIWLSEPMQATDAALALIPLAEHGPAQDIRLLGAGSLDMVRRHMDGAHWAEMIQASDLFDPDFYTRQLGRFAVPGMKPLWHYIHYGDLLGLDPSPAFSTAYYLLRHPEVQREGICSLAHYLHLGQHQGSIACPSATNWLTLAQDLGLFDPDWYAQRYMGPASAEISAMQHYLTHGQFQDHACSAVFDPARIPALRDTPPGPARAVTTWLQQYVLSEQQSHALLDRVLGAGDLQGAGDIAAGIAARFGTAPDPILPPAGPGPWAQTAARLAHARLSASGQRVRRPVPRPARKQDCPIVILYDLPHLDTGSTVLRGRQTAALLRAHLDGSRDVQWRCDRAFRDCIVILTKGLLKVTTPEELENLRRHNILIGDFVDDPLRPDLLDHLDILIASSLCGLRHMMRAAPKLPCCHITHHVDIRLPTQIKAPDDTMRAGYFGELANTIHTDRLAEKIAFHAVSTARQSNSWIKKLSEYNLHYAARQMQDHDGFKPFLKGFIAAHCGANIIVQRNAGDAPYYLGTDYPYLLSEDAGPEDILDMLRHAEEGFGGPEWQHAQAIMQNIAAHSSRAYVLAEWDALLSLV